MIASPTIVPTGYKQTDVGIIPDEWDILQVSNLGETKRGAGSTCIQYRQSGGVRLIRINDFFQDNPVFVEPTDEILRFAIHERDLLFAGTGASAGASYLPRKEWVGLPHSYNAPRIRVFENHSKEYLLFSLHADYVIRQQQAWFVGNAQPFLDTKAISGFSIAVPPTLAEQEAIAEALGDADALIESLEQLVAKKRHLKQATMQQLLTGKKRLPGFEQDETVAETELGTFPSDWSLRPLHSLIDPSRGIRYGIVQPGKFEPNGRYMIRGQDYSEAKGWANPTEVFRVSDVIEQRYRNARVKSGDIIMTIVGYCGHVEMVPQWLDGANLTQTTARIAIHADKAVPAFCKYVLQSEIGKKQVASHIKGAAQPGLNCGDIEHFLLSIPQSAEEQNAIAAIVSDMDAEIEATEAKLAKVRQIKLGMMQELLTGRIRLV